MEAMRQLGDYHNSMSQLWSYFYFRNSTGLASHIWVTGSEYPIFRQLHFIQSASILSHHRNNNKAPHIETMSLTDDPSLSINLVTQGASFSKKTRSLDSSLYVTIL